MNVFVTFRSNEARDTFLAELRSVWPEMAGRSFVPKRRPDAIFEHLDDADRQRLVELIGDKGDVHDDVKFEPFRPNR